MTGFLVAHQSTDRAQVLAAAGVAIVYAGGVALNDVADADTDITLHPGRPIPSGAVTRMGASAFGLALLAAGVIVSLAAGGPWAGAATTAAALLAFAYDFVTKDRRVIGALTLGLA